MAKLINRAVLLAVLESTYGEDPGSGYKGILANKGIEIKPGGEKIERDVIRQTYSPAGHVIGAKEYTLTFEAEIKGGGIDGVSLQDPELDPLIQACATQKETGYIIPVDNVSGTFQVGETINNTIASNTVGVLADYVISGSTGYLYIRDGQNKPSDNDALQGATSSATADTNGSPDDSIVYRPLSARDSMKSATIHFYRDGIRHVLTGVRGTWEMDFTVGKYPVAKFTMTGKYADPSDQTMPNPTFSNITPPVCFSAGLQIASLDMSLSAVTALQLRLGNEVRPRPDINAVEGRRGFEIVDRAPGGSVDPEATAISDYDPWTAWKTAGEQKIYSDTGDTDGNKIRVLVPRALYDDISYGDRDGILIYELPFTCKGGDEGDDELYLFFH